MFALLLSVLVSAPAMQSPLPSDCNELVRLVEDGPDPVGNRTPLILIHGIHGVPNGHILCETEESPFGFVRNVSDKGYWDSFRTRTSLRAPWRNVSSYTALSI